MAAYMVVLLKNRSTDWLGEYVASVPTIFRRYGGEYLGVSKRLKQFEGPDFGGDTSAIFTFPSLEKIEEFMSSADYKPFADLRKKHSDAIVFALDTE